MAPNGKRRARKSPAGEDGAVGVDKVPRETAKAITDGGFGQPCWQTIRPAARRLVELGLKVRK
jgi:hypothetical protein